MSPSLPYITNLHIPIFIARRPYIIVAAPDETLNCSRVTATHSLPKPPSDLRGCSLTLFSVAQTSQYPLLHQAGSSYNDREARVPFNQFSSTQLSSPSARGNFSSLLLSIIAEGKQSVHA